MLMKNSVRATSILLKDLLRVVTMSDQRATYDAKLAEIERLGKDIQDGRVSVDELPAVVERGKGLLFECKAMLECATAQVEASLKEIDDGDDAPN